MIYLCSLYSQDNWDSTFTTNGIILDVADIIHIQNTGERKPMAAAGNTHIQGKTPDMAK